MKVTRRLLVGLVATVATASLALLIPAAVRPAAAASLTQVSNFGDNPGNLAMYVYVPNVVPANPAILLAMHPCGGSGPGFYSSSQFAALADQYGFIVIYPSASKKSNCFDNWSDASKVRGGRTDPVSLMSMITYVEQHYSGDPGRVYATGSSSGAMMTNAMLALYPEVFKAGAAFMGVPFTCFPNEAAYQPGGNSAPCVNKTAQYWGDVVRQANPSYSGPWPRMQLWHGTADTVVSYSELAEEVKQWTNVNGLSQTPTSTDTPQSGWTRQRYADSGGTVRVEAITVSGAGHSLPATGMAAYAIAFFGLDRTSPSTPPVSPSTSRSPSPPPSSPPVSSPPVSSPPVSSPPVSSPPGNTGGCRVSDTITAWNNGLVANLTISNTGASAVNGWSLTFTLPGGQTITSGWNASYAPGSGAVTARNLNYNASIPAGGSTSIGFQATHTGNAAAPGSFALNGVTCAVG
jgi:poly(hydroxyalkanoate) depolymerase family esterase